ncbi:MAG: hypothetical protein U0514_00340 [Candidatus Andersenbacteria bacterium]
MHTVLFISAALICQQHPRAASAAEPPPRSKHVEGATPGGTKLCGAYEGPPAITHDDTVVTLDAQSIEPRFTAEHVACTDPLWTSDTTGVYSITVPFSWPTTIELNVRVAVELRRSIRGILYHGAGTFMGSDQLLRITDIPEDRFVRITIVGTPGGEPDLVILLDPSNRRWKQNEGPWRKLPTERHKIELTVPNIAPPTPKASPRIRAAGPLCVPVALDRVTSP